MKRKSWLSDGWSKLPSGTMKKIWQAVP
jgi:hypothetical protein